MLNNSRVQRNYKSLVRKWSFVIVLEDAKVSKQCIKVISATNRFLGNPMAALRSRYGHYIFVLWFLLFSSYILSHRKLDVCHT